jgi:heptosyltransferase-2
MDSSSRSPILIVPYMWIGDFVRCHSVVRILRERWPERSIDMLSTRLCAPLVDYMPGLRQAIVFELPRGRLPLGRYRELAQRLKHEHYGTALIMLRTWKSALAPYLAGIPERIGFFGEGRFGLLNDIRWGERRLERMIDRCGALALPKGVQLPAQWPVPQLTVSAADIAAWRERHRLPADGGPVVAMGPGAVGAGKAWPPEHYADVARRLTERGIAVWILGGPAESELGRSLAAAAGPLARDLTGHDLREAIIALAAVDAAITNDSGLMHIAAALGTPTVAIFGPTSPRLWGPLNPLAAALEPPGPAPLSDSDVKRRRSADVSPDRVMAAVQDALRGAATALNA